MGFRPLFPAFVLRTRNRNNAQQTQDGLGAGFPTGALGSDSREAFRSGQILCFLVLLNY
jgi:hypothetical protein